LGCNATLDSGRRALRGNLHKRGRLEAADAETAIEKYDIEPEHQARLAARRIVTAGRQ